MSVGQTYELARTCQSDTGGWQRRTLGTERVMTAVRLRLVLPALAFSLSAGIEAAQQGQPTLSNTLDHRARGQYEPPAQTAPQATFRLTSSGVRLDVFVDDGRHPVAGLQPSDFELKDSGIAQRIDVVNAADRPLDVTVLIDLGSWSTADTTRFVSDTARIAELLRPGDRLRVLTTAAWIGVREVFPLSAVTQVGPDLTAVTAQPEERRSPGAIAERYAGAFRSPRGTVCNGLVEAMTWGGDGERLSLVIAYSQFWESNSVVGLTALQQMAEATQAVLYLAQAPPTAPLRANPLIDRDLDRAAETTGGSRVAYDGMLKTLSRVLEDYRESYLVTYAPVGVPLTGWHAINVVVVKAGTGKYNIRARKGYWGG